MRVWHAVFGRREREIFLHSSKAGFLGRVALLGLLERCTVLYIPLESYGFKKGIDWTPYPIYYFDPRAYNLKVTS